MRDVELLDEFFVNALGGLITVVADTVEIQLEAVAKYPFEKLMINKTYGPMWEKFNEHTKLIKIA